MKSSHQASYFLIITLKYTPLGRRIDIFDTWQGWSWLERCHRLVISWYLEAVPAPPAPRDVREGLGRGGLRGSSGRERGLLCDDQRGDHTEPDQRNLPGGKNYESWPPFPPVPGFTTVGLLSLLSPFSFMDLSVIFWGKLNEALPPYLLVGRANPLAEIWSLLSQDPAEVPQSICSPSGNSSSSSDSSQCQKGKHFRKGKKLCKSWKQKQKWSYSVVSKTFISHFSLSETKSSSNNLDFWFWADLLMQQKLPITPHTN